MDVARKECRRSGIPMHPAFNEYQEFLRYVGERNYDTRLRLRDKAQGYVPGNMYWKDHDCGEYWNVDLTKEYRYHMSGKRMFRHLEDEYMISDS